MATDKYHFVVGSHGGRQATLHKNGVPLEHVKSFQVNASAHDVTTVTIEFQNAEVEIEAEVERDE